MGTLIALLLATSGVSLEVEPGVGCVTKTGLEHRLQAAGESLTASATALKVTLRGSQTAIVLEGLRSDGRRLSREVPLEADCPSVERAVTLLVLTWANEKQLPSLNAQ